MNCTKRTYKTMEEASEAMIRIMRKSQEEKYPIRYYQCDKCGDWHLTSSTKSEHSSKSMKWENVKARRQEKREQSFLRRESEYWEQKFK